MQYALLRRQGRSVQFTARYKHRVRVKRTSNSMDRVAYTHIAQNPLHTFPRNFPGKRVQWILGNVRASNPIQIPVDGEATNFATGKLV